MFGLSIRLCMHLCGDGLPSTSGSGFIDQSCYFLFRVSLDHSVFHVA